MFANKASMFMMPLKNNNFNFIMTQTSGDVTILSQPVRFTYTSDRLWTDYDTYVYVIDDASKYGYISSCYGIIDVMMAKVLAVATIGTLDMHPSEVSGWYSLTSWGTPDIDGAATFSFEKF